MITGGLPINYPQNLKSSFIPITNGTINGFPFPYPLGGRISLLGLLFLLLLPSSAITFTPWGEPGVRRGNGRKVRMTKFLCFVLTGGLAPYRRPGVQLAARGGPGRW